MTAPPLLPRVDTFSERFWEALKNEVVLMPRCRQCGHIQYPMGPCCSNCLADLFDWIELSGRGTVSAFVVYHHAFHSSLEAKVPYNVAEVCLEEGVIVITNLVGIDNDRIEPGMQVRAVFEPAGEFKLLKFVPDASSD